uniref:Hedgehog protein n=1 Tax=Ciona intestinalis TaxID=7719 RepID=Q8MY57_CIOIN|nr:hedgehog homolog 1 [Ciona intestinalis]BAC06180.1 hedgehog homolog 1 [Ciona intestinalis]|eukprot:NP_001027634.1 hedgehog homolog 1 [Ciona intestinalis]
MLEDLDSVQARLSPDNVNSTQDCCNENGSRTPAASCNQTVLQRFTNLICTCNLRRRQLQRLCFSTRKHKSHRSGAGYCTLLPTCASIRVHIAGFLAWTLLVAPLLSGIAMDTRLLRRRSSLGGVSMCGACRPGHGSGGSRMPGRELVPFLKGEYVPKMSEQTIGASGPVTGRIRADTPRFRQELVPNWNTDIEFRDEEESNEDRFMTPICRARLDYLAILVANQWARVKLKVLEAWDDGNDKANDPLHYEGRAVDITTDDADRNKYPILARLAVVAGFDWVKYDGKVVHCSVKSEESDAAKYGGCFPGESTVIVPGEGHVPMSSLQPGDQVLAIDKSGAVITDTFLSFMDARSDIVSGHQAYRQMVEITTENGFSVTLTRNHLIYVSKPTYDASLLTATSNATQQNNERLGLQDFTSPHSSFAAKVRQGDYIYTLPNSHTGPDTPSATVRPSRVVSVRTIETASGAYAPLTYSGTIIVGGTAASCYAVIESDVIAHTVVSPFRYYHWLSLWFNGDSKDHRNCTHVGPVRPTDGISLYSKLLHQIFSKVLPSWFFWAE